MKMAEDNQSFPPKIGGQSFPPVQGAQSFPPSTPIGPVVTKDATQYLRFPSDITSTKNFPYTMFTIKQYNEPNIIKDLAEKSSRVTGAIYGPADPNANSADKQFSDNRSQQTIVLSLPQELSNSYKPEWEMADQIFINDITRAVQNTGMNIGSFASAAKHFTTSLLFGPMTKAAQMAVTNPKKQALFNGIEPRSFTFNYVLIAQNLHEAETIEKIIKTFIKYSLPKKSNANADFFLFPYEYEIRFKNVSGFPIIKNCICNGVSTNYGVESIQLLKSNHVTEIGISLDFTEIDLRTFDEPGI